MLFLGGETAHGLLHEGELLGLLVLGPKETGTYTPEDLNLLILTDSLDDARDIMVDCYNTRCWTTWKRSEGAKVDADPHGAPGTAPDPAKADAQ